MLMCLCAVWFIQMVSATSHWDDSPATCGVSDRRCWLHHLLPLFITLSHLSCKKHRHLPHTWWVSRQLSPLAVVKPKYAIPWQKDFVTLKKTISLFFLSSILRNKRLITFLQMSVYIYFSLSMFCHRHCATEDCLYV